MVQGTFMTPREFETRRPLANPPSMGSSIRLGVAYHQSS